MAFWGKWFGKGRREGAKGAPLTDEARGLSAGTATGVVATIVEGPGGTSGFFERAYDRDSRTVELRYAFRDDLPAWIAEAPVPLVPGRGVPTVTYVTLRAMRQLGVAEGEARAFVMRCIHEVRSVLHLAWLTAKHPDVALGELARQTHSYEYAETAIVQSGHKVVAVRVDTAGAVRRPIGELMVHYERMAGDPDKLVAEHDALLEHYSATREREILFGYDLHIEVVPWK